MPSFIWGQKVVDDEPQSFANVGQDQFLRVGHNSRCEKQRRYFVLLALAIHRLDNHPLSLLPSVAAGLSNWRAILEKVMHATHSGAKPLQKMRPVLARGRWDLAFERAHTRLVVD